MFAFCHPQIKVIKERMLHFGFTVASAESLTCGHIQASLGSISEASRFFEGGITAYNLRQKVAILGVDQKHAAQVNCVSPTVAAQMARSVCMKFSVDLGLSTTGYAEPDVENGIYEPFAYFAICHSNFKNYKDQAFFTLVSEGKISGPALDRNEMQYYVTERVLQKLADYLDSLLRSSSDK